MPAPQPKPWNVHNPTTEHTARLQYGQALRLTLGSPFEMGFTPNYTWWVQADSPLLKLRSTGVVPGEYGPMGEYIFEQVNVPVRWMRQSTLFLGNVHIFTRGNTSSEDKSLWTSICVFLVCTSESKQDTITVMEPDDQLLGLAPSVKLEPRQKLEVVVTDPDAEKLEWRSYILPSKDSSSSVQLRYHSSVTLGVKDGIVAADSSIPPDCERLLAEYHVNRPFLFGDELCDFRA